MFSFTGGGPRCLWHRGLAGRALGAGVVPVPEAERGWPRTRPVAWAPAASRGRAAVDAAAGRRRGAATRGEVSDGLRERSRPSEDGCRGVWAAAAIGAGTRVGEGHGRVRQREAGARPGAGVGVSGAPAKATSSAGRNRRAWRLEDADRGGGRGERRASSHR